VRVEATCIYCTSLLLLPLATNLVGLLFNCVLLWLGSDFQAKEESLSQARVFKVLLVTSMSFLHPSICSGYEIDIDSGCMGLFFP
jgi:hypothetical protein